MTTLAGRRVVVTRSLDQAGSLLERLRAAGAEAVLVPLIEVVAVEPDASALAALDPDDFDWVVVTSPNGADAFHRAHPAPGRARVAAVGAVTAERLQRCDLVPERQRAAGVVAALAGEAPGRVLVVQAVDAAPTLVDGLRAAGHEVTTLTPYRSRSVAPHEGAADEIATADAVLFASGSAGRAWVAAFGTGTPPWVVAIGPQTAADLVKSGLKVDVVAADHSVNGMVAALEQCLGSVK
jgi:uroporphyrinogen-III synthase